jgi:hypothetical protein
MSDVDVRVRWMREALAPYGSSESEPRGISKLSISLPKDLVELVKATAHESGMSVSATIAASLRRTLVEKEQELLDRALELDADENRAWAEASADVHARLIAELEW